MERVVRPWNPDEIDSGVSLYEVQEQERLDTFCEFLRTLGAALGRRVVVYAGSAYESDPPMTAYEIVDLQTRDRRHWCD
jgi:hypothetical protein